MNSHWKLEHRARLYNAAFAKWPASHLVVTENNGREWLTGYWCLGNDFRNKSRLYGAYPPNYLKRVMSMFPDAENILHLFSGSLPEGNYTRFDIQGEVDVQGDAHQLSEFFEPGQFDLVIADPPYSKEDAKKYNFPMVKRKPVVIECAAVTRAGGYLVWLDCVYPPFRKKDGWQLGGFIGIARSTNHRFRTTTIFCKGEV